LNEFLGGYFALRLSDVESWILGQVERFSSAYYLSLDPALEDAVA